MLCTDPVKSGSPSLNKDETQDFDYLDQKQDYLK